MITQICSFKDCKELGTTIAVGHSGHFPLGIYCDKHAQIVANDTLPEYTVNCPCCGCKFGVN